ncbi:MAG: hypothetical protein PVI86_16360, partial [Phycisphaerae bacterium]
MSTTGSPHPGPIDWRTLSEEELLALDPLTDPQPPGSTVHRVPAAGDVPAYAVTRYSNGEHIVRFDEAPPQEVA